MNACQFCQRVGIAFALCMLASGCGGGGEPSAAPPSSTLEPGQIIPSDVLISKQRVDLATPPIRYKAVQGWAQAVTLTKTQSGETARLEMDFLRLLEEDLVLGTLTIVAEATFDAPAVRLICVLPNGRCDGALYERTPWFASDTHIEMANSIVSNGTLQIDLSPTPNKVAHWWTPRGQQSAPGRRYYVETRFKITGKAALQLGVDYWLDVGASYNHAQDDGCKNESNNCQAWASIWFGDTSGVFVTRKVPIF